MRVARKRRRGGVIFTYKRAAKPRPSQQSHTDKH